MPPDPTIHCSLYNICVSNVQLLFSPRVVAKLA